MVLGIVFSQNCSDVSCFPGFNFQAQQADYFQLMINCFRSKNISKFISVSDKYFNREFDDRMMPVH